MTSLTFLLYRHWYIYYDVTGITIMTSLTFLLYRHWYYYYDVTGITSMTSLVLLLYRHWYIYYDVTVFCLVYNGSKDSSRSLFGKVVKH